MAQRKYKSYTKEKGFVPAQVSDANVKQILTEGNRQVNVLKEQFSYEKSQRDLVLSTMKDNARNEKQDREANFNLETQNRANIQDRVQSSFRTEQANIERQGEAQAKIYESLSSLSKTANEELAKLDQKKFDKDYEDQMIKIMMGEVDVVKQAEFQDTEADLFVASAENDIGANALAAAGAPPIQVQRVRANSKGRQYANNKAQAILTMQGFMPYAKKVLDGMPEVTDPAQKREVMLGLLKPYMQETGLYGLSPQFLTEPLLKAREGIGEYFRTEDEAYTKELQVKASEESTTALLGDPTNMLANSAQLIRDKTVELGSRSQAVSWVIETAGANMSDAEWEQFSNLTLPGKDRPVKSDFEPRWNKANQAREAKRRDNYSNTEKDRQQKLQQLERQLISALDGANEAEVKAILKAYQESPFNPGKVASTILTDRANQVSKKAVNFDGALATKIQMAELGLYTQEDLAAETDPRFAKDESLALLAKQNSNWRNAEPVSQGAEDLEGFFAISRGMYDASTNEFKWTAAGRAASYRIKNEYYSRIQQLLADPSKNYTHQHKLLLKHNNTFKTRLQNTLINQLMM